MDIEKITQKLKPVFDIYNDQYENAIQWVGVFGSIARGKKQPNDIDLLVSSSHMPYGVWGMVGLRERIKDVLGMEVDIVSKRGARPEFIASINKDMVTIYER